MRKLNWIRDIFDPRDWKYSKHHLLTVEPLPMSVDLRPKCSPIENQDQLGSCTSFAWAGMLEFLELQALNNKIASTEILGTSYESFSHLFIYYNERLIDGDINSDSGAQLRDGAQAVATYGDCAESFWPYNESQVFVKPSDQAYQEAANHKISTYYRLETPDDYKRCLADGFPFVFGATLYSSFDSVPSTGIVPMPSINEEIIGGHALLCVGYDTEKQYYIIRNSWSDSWGDKGYCYFPMQYIENQDLCNDMWTVRR